MAAVLVVTIDTEADNEWSTGGPSTFANTQALPELQDLCDRYAVKPTYLVTYDVARDERSREVLRALRAGGRCEIGAHLHAWSTPPHYDLVPGPSGARPYLHEYPPEIQAEKLRSLTECLREAFDVEPQSYRGGRWSLDRQAVQHLLAARYLVDTSVTPGVTWRATPGHSPGAFGPSFLGACVSPYRIGTEDVTARAADGLLEVPVSILPRGPLHWLPAGHQSARGGGAAQTFCHRLLAKSRLSRPVWLRPGFSSARTMIWLAGRLCGRNVPVLNLMFHSSELLPGVGPKSSSRRGAEGMLSSLDLLFAHVIGSLEVECMTLAEFAGTLGGSLAGGAMKSWNP